MKIKELLSAIGLAPKSLEQAKATLASAQPALDSVAALFAAASLDLDTLLAAGPDSLKAHIEGLSAKDGELAAAQEKVSELTASLATANTETSNAKAAFKTVSDQLSAVHAAIGFDAKAKDADFKTALSAHVAKESALLLAKDGRSPVTHSPAKDAKEVAKDPTAKGRDRYQADFHAQALKLAGRS